MTSQPAPKPPQPLPDDDEPVETNDVGDPKKIGKYDIIKKLGQGGMGAVFLARDAALRRDVALKVLPKDKAENPTLVRRFQAEAQAAAKLRHDNIVAVYDSDAADGMCYIAMEFVDGKDLHEHVSRRGPVPVKRSIEIVKQVAQALQHAFEHNIVHRDIKPSNLLIRRDGVVKLTDLGLARSVDDSIETGITRAGTTVGTVDYMAPEQGRSSKAADIRSDLYSLGCTWYFMLTGQPPFPDGSMTNKLQAHAIKPPPDPRALNENVSDGLVAVIMRLLEKKPDARYQTPAELIEDLNTAALTRNAIAREIFDEPEEVEEAPVRSRSSKKSVLPDDIASLDAPTRDRSKKKPTLPDDHLPLDAASRPRGGSKRSRVEEEYEEPISTPRRRRSDEPGSDVDIYADDPDEAPVRRTRTKEPIAPIGAIHSLDDLSADAISSAAPSGKTNRQPGVLPPPSRRVQDDSKDEPAGINLEWLKMVGAAVGVVIVVGGLGWLVASYSGQFFGPDPNMVGPAPAATGIPGKQEVEVAAVGAAVNSDKPMIDSGTQVAQVIPTGQNIGPDGKPLQTGQTGRNATGVSPEGSALTPPQVSPGPGVNSATGGTATPLDPEKIPEWADGKASSHNHVMTVGPGANTGTHFGALSEALSRVGPDGALIQLIGSGPFVLSTPSKVSAKRLILAAEANSKPIIVLGSAGEGLVGSLQVSGHLELNGVHISLDRQAWKGTDPVTAISVMEGTLTLRDSSATVIGTGSAPLFLFSLEGAGPGSRLLVDRSFIRGEPDVALNVRCDTVDAVVRDSVIATGSGSNLRLSCASAAANQKTPPRVIRSLRSTWCSTRAVCDISGDNERETPPHTHFVLLDSVCTTGSDEGPRVCLAAEDWLQDTLRQSVTWTSKSTAYLGFEALLDLGKKSAFRVKNAEHWQQFWQQKVDADQFLEETWPAGLGPLATVAALEFDRNQTPAAVQKLARKGEPVGTETAKLLIPESTHPARLAALSQRRPLPNDAVQALPLGKTRKVDLKKEDLGVILSRADWSNGTVFEAIGYGNCPMTPVQLQGRQLRIVFRQADGAPLKIVPKDSGKDVDALVRIERGSIEFEDLRYQSPEARSTLPAWFLSAIDSQVILRRCELVGPEKLAAPYLGGLKFASTPKASASQPPTLSLMQCLVQAPGTTLRIEGSAAAVFVRNSLIVSRGTLLDMRPVAVQNGLPVSVDIVQSTLSATDTIFHMTAASLSGPATRGVQCFVDNCVFGPPFSLRPGDADSPTLMTLSGPVHEQQQLAWWGQSNGVSRVIRQYLKSINPTAPPITDPAKWSELWDDGHDIQLLTVADGVLPKDPLPTKRDALKGSSYALHPSSKGMTWADGRAIGADGKQLDGIGPQKPAPEPAANTKKPGANPKPAGTSKTGGF